MKEFQSTELKKIIQSAHINFLVGSGCSQKFLNTLHDIEIRMNDKVTEIAAKKEYYHQIVKSKNILKSLEDLTLTEESEELGELKQTSECYAAFLTFWLLKIFERSSPIVNKQINIFTTNFDMFLEKTCETKGIPYNDGFSGQISPTFDVANFNRIEKYKSLQFDNISDVPLFNIIKLHGSVSWNINSGSIKYSIGDHIPDDLEDKADEDFLAGYKKIAIVNPNAEKHFETVLNTTYAAMLRKFTLELEKENSLLLIFGFSLQDKHIRSLLYSAMKANPTLIVVYFSFSKYDSSINDHLEEACNHNFYIINGSMREDNFPFPKQVEYVKLIFSKNRQENVKSDVKKK